MNDPMANGARAAARRLASQYGPSLADDVEAALHSQNSDRRPDQYADPVAVASLIVSAATLAWTIYNDLKSRASNPSPEYVSRTVITQIRQEHELTDEQRNVITVTVQETLTAPADPPPPLS
ncbi:hypothetical protein [Thermomonospora cellulosilytica]|uniref:Uncharacterized protein n=1 Tax=Thermomonospora cellulosilytica TaxID=1411118 RepID=A0A7W3R763_9ACTN|nr:hypothetical protein [Thermomonospora cellulosilytica]MBA9002372.1 hypothetical protein [Thermomonospora cellulosilytica]